MARPISPILICLVILATAADFNAADRPDKDNKASEGGRFSDGKTTNIPLGEKGTHDLYLHWMEKAIGGLMAAIANAESERISDQDRDDLFACSKKANTLPSHAKCVVKAVDAQKVTRIVADPKKKKKESKPKRTETLRQQPTKEKTAFNSQPAKAVGRFKHVGAKRINFASKKQLRPNDHLEWIGGFGVSNRRLRLNRRAKRQISVRHATTYQLQLPKQGVSPFGEIADFLTETVRGIKRKNNKTTWRGTYAQLKMQTLQQRQRQIERDAIRARFDQLLEAPPEQLQNPRRPLAMKSLELVPELKKHMDEYDRYTQQQQQQHANVSTPSPEQLAKARLPIQVVRDIVRMGLAVAGQNTTAFDNKTVKLISPRFLSVVPEEKPDDLVNLLSPSLFSLHEEGDGIEKLFSLPQIFKKLNNADQEKWMDFIVEAAGVSDIVDRVMKMDDGAVEKERKQRLGVGKNGEPLYFTKKNATDVLGKGEERKFDVWEKLYGSYSDKQMHQMKGRGFAFLDRHQLDMLYGADAPYNGTKLGFDIDGYANLTDDERERLLTENIRGLSAAKDFDVRLKDIVGTPITATPLIGVPATVSNTFIVLSPLTLSPLILSPSVLGPIILSPWVFVPIILSPRVLAPLILFPIVGSPLILSPLVLHPFILTPGVMNPFILNPFVLSPLILSPQVMTPLILSPFVLSPIILSPGVMNPLILSPFALSPVILSPQVLFALVLSPNVLSPLVDSPLAAASVIASPSLLS